jgi:U3 small nucleolar RNA-associated protein 5
LNALVSTHAAQMISHPNIKEALAPILSLIDAKQMLLAEITRLKGRVELVTGQISERIEKQEKDVTEECLLVYQDQGMYKLK